VKPARGSLVLRSNPAFDRLAHAAARSELERASESTRRVWERAKQGKTLGAAFKILRGHFSDLVLQENVKRPVGSRALGDLMLIVLNFDGAEIVQVRWDGRLEGQKLYVLDGGVEVNLHAIARAMQRSVHRDDLLAAARVLRQHLWKLSCVEAELRRRLVPGTDFELSGCGGALLGEIVAPVDNEFPFPRFRVKTWVPVDLCFDDAQRERYAGAEYLLGATLEREAP